MVSEDNVLIVMGCGILAAILPYLLFYIYNKNNGKIVKWRAGILLANYIFIIIIINGIITGLITVFIQRFMQNTDVLIANIISACFYGGMNTLICLASNEFKMKGKKFLLYFAITILVLTILSIIGSKVINIYDIIFVIFSIFNFYYYKTLDLEDITPPRKTKPLKIKKISMQETQEKYDTLRKLKSLYDDKIITKEEFEKEKERILK